MGGDEVEISKGISSSIACRSVPSRASVRLDAQKQQKVGAGHRLAVQYEKACRMFGVAGLMYMSLRNYDLQLAI